MKDLEKMISGLGKSGFMSGMAGGAVSGVITNLAMGKKSKKMGKKALKVGALAAVGGLAWKAYQSYSQGKQATSQGQGQPQQQTFQSAQPTLQPDKVTLQSQHQGRTFDYSHSSETRFAEVVEDNVSDNGQLLLMQAMIAAAYADGHIDAQEQQRIFQQVETMELSVAEKASLFDELRNPKTPGEIVSKVPDAETGMEVYAASLLAIDESQTASQRYLDQLAMSLCIPSELRSAIHSHANQARLS